MSGRRLVQFENIWTSRCHMSASCGGLFRNSDGQWLGGFLRNLGRCNAYIVELCGVYDGFCLARNKGVKKMKVHVRFEHCSAHS
jgi:hypothetical protein